MMNNELEKYYEARFEMFASKGWKDLVEDLQRTIESASDLNQINNEAQLFFKKGQLDILSWIVSMDKITEQAYKDLSEDQYEVHA